MCSELFSEGVCLSPQTAEEAYGIYFVTWVIKIYSLSVRIPFTFHSVLMLLGENITYDVYLKQH